MAVAKEQIRQIISENNISSVADVYSLLKESFKDILQELMEAELDASLGYEKNQKGDLTTTNKRNGHSPKTLKSQYGEFQVGVPRDRNGEFEPRLIPKYQRDISGIEEKVISLYARGMSTRDITTSFRNSMGLNYPQRWSARSQIRSCLRSRSGNPVPCLLSIPLYLWTVFIIKYGKMGGYSAGQLMWCWELPPKVIRKSLVSP